MGFLRRARRTRLDCGTDSIVARFLSSEAVDKGLSCFGAFQQPLQVFDRVM